MSKHAIMRMEKRHDQVIGKIENHHERKKEYYASNPDIDPARKHLNYYIMNPPTSYREEIKKRTDTAECKVRKDSVMFIDAFVSASPEYMEGLNPQEQQRYFKRAYQFFADAIGKDNVFAAVVHVDEKTPHMHLSFTPITEDGRLSAKEIMGNKTKMSQWQEDFYQYMLQGFPDLEPRKSVVDTGRKHIPTQLYKLATKLDAERKDLEEKLERVNLLNAKTKRKEIAELVQEMLPQIHSFSSSTKALTDELEQWREKASLLEENNEQMKRQLFEAERLARAAWNQADALREEIAEFKAFAPHVAAEIERLQSLDGDEWEMG